MIVVSLSLIMGRRRLINLLLLRLVEQLQLILKRLQLGDHDKSRTQALLKERIKTLDKNCPKYAYLDLPQRVQ